MDSNARLFRDALGKFATGVCVVTTRLADQAPFGMTINSFSSVSLDPPMVLWSLAKTSTYFDSVMSADLYTINILSDEQKALSKKYSGKDRVLDVDHTDLDQAEFPVIKGALAHFSCQVAHRYEGGDHIIIVGKVVNFSSAEAGEPLVFYTGDYRSLSIQTTA